MRSDDVAQCGPVPAATLTRGPATPAARHGAIAPRATAGSAPRRARSRRAVILTWLRRTHLYVGLWGAALGLLFGATGIVLNHRAVLKIPIAKTVQRTVQLAVPTPAFADVRQMSAWLQAELGFAPHEVAKAEAQSARTVVWADREVLQPERWIVGLQAPRRGVTAEYVVGNRFVRLDRVDATAVGLLTRLHMATGATVVWVLLSDTIAGGMILLSITGLLLWTQLHTVRTAAALVSVAALVAAACVVSAG